MARRTRGGSSPRAWTTFFYIFLVILLPFAFLNSAHAQDDDKTSKENLGDGQSAALAALWTLLTAMQSLVLISAPPTPVWV